MKPTLVVCFCLAAFASNAQFKTPASKFRFDSELFKPRPLTSASFSLVPSQPKATLIATNNLGKIYVLPKDNMPCLVPNISQVTAMPNARKYFDNSLMLNPYKTEEIIPQQ